MRGDDTLSKNGTIYVDIDDVISDSTKQFTHVLSEHFDKSCNIEEITSFDLQKSFHLTDDEYRHFMELIHAPEVLRNNDPVRGAAESIRKLNDHGYEIIVITGRPVTTYEDSLYWLESHEITFSELYFVDKYGRYDAETALPYVKQVEDLRDFNFTCAVEDSFATSLKLADMGIPVALLDRPWNRIPLAEDSKEASLINRCDGWQEVTRLIL